MICNGCHGVVGRDCFNPQECEWITHQMDIEAEKEAESERYAQIERAHFEQIERQHFEQQGESACIGALKQVMECYNKNGHLLDFDVSIARKALESALGKEASNER